MLNTPPPRLAIKNYNVSSLRHKIPDMKILLSNDDGYRAPGLAALAEALGAVFDVIVVAPEHNCSGASNSLSLRKPLRVRQSPGGPGRIYYVDGTPADCVHLAITGMFAKAIDWQPDMVVAGINEGPNLGDDVIYSGTVAAAIEGRFLGLPAIAVSLDGANHYSTAAAVVMRLLKNLRARPLPRDTILNINVPDLPLARLRGLRATRLGARHQSQSIIEEPNTPEQCPAEKIYRIGSVGDGADAGPGTDFDAVSAGAVSVTPLQIDMTRHNSVENLTRWLAEST